MIDVTPDPARDRYRAAASFYRQAPWRSVGLDEPIEVKSEPIQGGPRLAVVLLEWNPSGRSEVPPRSRHSPTFWFDSRQTIRSCRSGP